MDAAYAESVDLVLVGVLKGAVYFLTDLSRAMKKQHRIDFVEYASYRGTERGEGALIKSCADSVAGADVILVDEIVDSGQTSAAIRTAITAQGPRSVAVCALLVKSSEEGSDAVEFQGFHIGPEFLVGYGLDHNQQLRHLPHISVFEG